MGYPLGYPGHCPRCGATREHSDTFDAAFCRADDEWQAATCPTWCPECVERPARPSEARDLAVVERLERDTSYDLDLDDFAEVRRRVIDPVVTGLFTDSEVTSVEVYSQPATSPPWRHWPTDLGVPRDVWCRVTFFNAETAEVWLGYQGHSNPDDLAGRLAEGLEDEFTESRWGWGQRRVASYKVLPARA